MPSRTPRSPRPLAVALAAALAAVPLAVLTSSPAHAAPSDVRINEIISTSATAPDSIELTNVGAEPVDVSGWIVKDDNDSRTLAIPAGTTVAPGAFVVVPVDVPGGFGLGNGDAARIFLPDGTTLVDGHAYPNHSNPSWSRCPDGTGAFVQALSETLGAANDCPSVESLVINEVESSGDAVGDWIELGNPTGIAIDAAGVVVKDADDSRTLTVPAGTVVPAGGFAAVYTEPAGDPAGFGLGSADSARIFTPGGDLIDSYTWTTHAPTSYGRCPDLAGSFVATTASTRAAANDCPEAVTPDLAINEVKTNPNPDFVELVNTGTELIDVAGLKVADSAGQPVVITTESTPLLPGELFAFDPDAIAGGFGLGSSDSVTILAADGLTVIDTYSWTGHRIPSFGRCDVGTELVENAAATPGEPNLCQPVRLNEIESSGGTPGDWVELVNVTQAPADVSGWIVKDADDTHAYTIPAATTIAAQDHLVIEESALGFGLGGEDAVRLFRPDGTTLADSYSWNAHATTTYGRCPEGTGDVVTTRTATKDAVNDCPPPFFGVETQPWPGAAEVTESDALNAFVTEISAGDVSGLAFDPAEDGVLWAIKNKNRLFKLTKADGLWTPVGGEWATGKTLRFANGAGEPDTEGVTVGPDGAIYATSERDNTASGVPLNAVLRFDPTQSGTTLTATDEWNLDADFPELDTIPGGSNLGFEGLTWVSDSFLTAGGFVDQSTGAAYDPADYPGHGDGVFFMALENDGALYAYALGDTAHRVAVVPSGFPHAMDVTFDPERERIWVACDDTCEGQLSLLELGAEGAFVPDGGYERPAGMPNLNNEGFAIAPRSTCADGFKEVVWADDAGTGGHSLRSSTLPCTEIPDPLTPTVTASAAPVAYGRAGSVAVAVTAEGVVPTGEVTVTVGSASYDATLAADGTATVALPAGSLAPSSTPYPVTVAYAGDGAVAPGSGTTSVLVRKGVVRMVASVTPRTVEAGGRRATVVVRLANVDGVPVTGRVQVKLPGAAPRSVRIDDGRATLKLRSFKSLGAKRIVVTYPGNAWLEDARAVTSVRVVRRR